MNRIKKTLLNFFAANILTAFLLYCCFPDCLDAYAKIGRKFIVIGGLAALETGLCTLAVVAALRRKSSPMSSLTRTALALGFVASLFFNVALPVQSYLANSTLFEYSLGQLLLDCSWRFLVWWFLGSGLILLLMWSFGRVTGALLLAVVFCCYLESGPLAFGLPSLTGNTLFYENFGRGLAQLVVWGVVIIAFGAFFKFILGNLTWFSIALLVLIGASLLDVKTVRSADDSQFIVHDFYDKGAVVKCIEYAPQTNVIVLVLDSIMVDEAHAAIMRDGNRAVREQLTGFVEYQDNLGMHDLTHPGTAGILTGIYRDFTDRTYEDYDSWIWTERSVLKDYLDAGWKIYLNPGSSPFGYTTAEGVYQNAEATKTDLLCPMRVRIKDLQAWNLSEINLFRCCPFAFKKVFHRIISRGWTFVPGVSDEWVLYDIMAKAPKAAVNAPAFIYMHSAGTHIPIRYEEDGKLLAEVNDTHEGAINQASFLFRELGKLLDALRQKGIYDSSLIVVTADHGDHFEKYPPDDTSKLPTRARPFLWVKAPFAQGPFRESMLPTSHVGLAPLFRRAIRGNVTEKEVEKILSSDERKFVGFERGLERTWTVHPDGTLSYQEQDGFSLGADDLEALAQGKWYSLCEGTRFLLGDGRRRWVSECLYPDFSHFNFLIKTTKPNQAIALTMDIQPEAMEGDRIPDDWAMQFRQKGSHATWQKHTYKEGLEIKVHGLKTDAIGCVELECEKSTHPVRVFLMRVRIDSTSE